MRTISVKLVLFLTSGSGENVFKDISYQELWTPFCVLGKRTICAILVGDIRNNSMKLF